MFEKKRLRRGNKSESSTTDGIGHMLLTLEHSRILRKPSIYDYEYNRGNMLFLQIEIKVIGEQLGKRIFGKM